jgi:hypothetical protein
LVRHLDIDLDRSRWALAVPAWIRWDALGDVLIRDFDLREVVGPGRLALDGRIFAGQTVDLELEATAVPLGPILAIMPSGSAGHGPAYSDLAEHWTERVKIEGHSSTGSLGFGGSPDGDKLMVIIRDPANNQFTDSYFSADRGETWEKRGKMEGATFPVSTAVRGSNVVYHPPTSSWFACVHTGHTGTSNTQQRMFRSINDGTTWTVFASSTGSNTRIDMKCDVAVSQEDDRIVWAGAESDTSTFFRLYDSDLTLLGTATIASTVRIKGHLNAFWINGEGGWITTTTSSGGLERPLLYRCTWDVSLTCTQTFFREVPGQFESAAGGFFSRDSWHGINARQTGSGDILRYMSGIEDTISYDALITVPNGIVSAGLLAFPVFRAAVFSENMILVGRSNDDTGDATKNGGLWWTVTRDLGTSWNKGPVVSEPAGHASGILMGNIFIDTTGVVHLVYSELDHSAGSQRQALYTSAHIDDLAPLPERTLEITQAPTVAFTGTAFTVEVLLLESGIPVQEELVGLVSVPPTSLILAETGVNGTAVFTFQINSPGAYDLIAGASGLVSAPHKITILARGTTGTNPSLGEPGSLLDFDLEDIASRSFIPVAGLQFLVFILFFITIFGSLLIGLRDPAISFAIALAASLSLTVALSVFGIWVLPLTVLTATAIIMTIHRLRSARGGAGP